MPPFMVPMAVSAGFGVLFATLVTLVLAPTAYMILDDVGRTMRGIFGRPEPEAGPAPSVTAAERSAAMVAEAGS